MARKNVLNRAVAAAVPPAAPETQDAPDTPETPAVVLVTVKALGWVAEDGLTYKPGDVFETTPERASALAGNVEIIAANG
jgi:hypothetical protein